jgi:hypothetical protein
VGPSAGRDMLLLGSNENLSLVYRRIAYIKARSQLRLTNQFFVLSSVYVFSRTLPIQISDSFSGFRN